MRSNPYPLALININARVATTNRRIEKVSDSSEKSSEKYSRCPALPDSSVQDQKKIKTIMASKATPIKSS